MDFEAFQKIPRLKRDCVITEKIDGTNAQINIKATHLSESSPPDQNVLFTWVDGTFQYDMRAGSRNRWITPENDNAGFAAWVKANAGQLAVELGEGQHFGEWWGAGIQRRYNIGEKRFSLFNTSRWNNAELKLCHVVPVLYHGTFSTDAIDKCVDDLRVNGSRAAPGFMNPEGIIIFHAASRGLFKVTLEKDEMPKGIAEAA